MKITNLTDVAPNPHFWVRRPSEITAGGVTLEPGESMDLSGPELAGLENVGRDLVAIGELPDWYVEARKVRARREDGKFKGDDPATSDKDEAWDPPKKKAPAKKKTRKKK